MRNEVIFDSRGIPDTMVVFTPDELGLPAEIRGKAVKEYAISKYPNTLIGGVPYSMPYQQPAVNINHDEAIRLCEAKGPGWHLLTNDEWAALAHQSRKNGTLPRGNTDCGKSHSHPEETGTTYKGDSGSSKTLTGSGPVTWNHTHTAEGVADMCGNIWEHVGGIRFMDGQDWGSIRNDICMKWYLQNWFVLQKTICWRKLKHTTMPIKFLCRKARPHGIISDKGR